LDSCRRFSSHLYPALQVVELNPRLGLILVGRHEGRNSGEPWQESTWNILSCRPQLDI